MDLGKLTADLIAELISKGATVTRRTYKNSYPQGFTYDDPHEGSTIETIEVRNNASLTIKAYVGQFSSGHPYPAELSATELLQALDQGVYLIEIDVQRAMNPLEPQQTRASSFQFSSFNRFTQSPDPITRQGYINVASTLELIRATFQEHHPR